MGPCQMTPTATPDHRAGGSGQTAGGIRDVAHDQIGLRRRIAGLSAGQVVQHDHPLSGRDKVAADKTGTAGDRNRLIHDIRIRQDRIAPRSLRRKQCSGAGQALLINDLVCRSNQSGTG